MHVGALPVALGLDSSSVLTALLQEADFGSSDGGFTSFSPSCGCRRGRSGSRSRSRSRSRHESPVRRYLCKARLCLWHQNIVHRTRGKNLETSSSVATVASATLCRTALRSWMRRLAVAPQSSTSAEILDLGMRLHGCLRLSHLQVMSGTSAACFLHETGAQISDDGGGPQHPIAQQALQGPLHPLRLLQVERSCEHENKKHA